MSDALRALPGVRFEELYPEWSTEVDRRIAASEIRIKFWVVGGTLMNFIVAVGAAIPLIFYMGTISSSITQSSADIKAQSARLDTNTDWVRDRMVWEARVETALEKQNIHVERNGR